MLYTLRFFSSNCSLFHNANLFGSCIIHILYTGCAEIKKNNSGAKGLIKYLELSVCVFWRSFSLVLLSHDGRKMEKEVIKYNIKLNADYSNRYFLCEVARNCPPRSLVHFRILGIFANYGPYTPLSRAQSDLQSKMVAFFCAQLNDLFLYYKVERLNFISEQIRMAARNNFPLFHIIVLRIYIYIYIYIYI